MSNTIPAFMQAATQAQHWVNELSEELGWSERRAYRLLRTVLHALRDGLGKEEMADLAAQLPTMMRGVFFEGWRPGSADEPPRRKEMFVERVQRELANEPLEDPEMAIAAVFRLLDRHVDQGEIEQVRHSMKKGLRQLWPAH
jgi:uncharacterized protein (DUF2267 family)